MPSVGARTAGVVLSFAGESMRSPRDEGGAGAERPGLRWRPQRQARRASRVGSTSYQRRSPSQTRRSRRRRSDRPPPATTRLNSVPGPCSTAVPYQDFHARRPITQARGGAPKSVSPVSTSPRSRLLSQLARSDGLVAVQTEVELELALRDSSLSVEKTPAAWTDSPRERRVPSNTAPKVRLTRR